MHFVPLCLVWKQSIIKQNRHLKFKYSCLNSMTWCCRCAYKNTCKAEVLFLLRLYDCSGPHSVSDNYICAWSGSKKTGEFPFRISNTSSFFCFEIIVHAGKQLHAESFTWFWESLWSCSEGTEQLWHKTSSTLKLGTVVDLKPVSMPANTVMDKGPCWCRQQFHNLPAPSPWLMWGAAPSVLILPSMSTFWAKILTLPPPLPPSPLRTSWLP